MLPSNVLGDLNLLDIGNSLQFAGVIYAGAEQHYLAYLSDEAVHDGVQHRVLKLTSQDWEKVVRQTDLLETEILAKAADGKLAKVLIRKSTRQIEQGVSWAVYHRDGYKCRYCGAQGIPLTVDHAPIPWELGGPSIEENLVAACRKCNKVKANKAYVEWLSDPFYLRVSAGLDEATRSLNRSLLLKTDIPVRIQQRSR